MPDINLLIEKGSKAIKSSSHTRVAAGALLAQVIKTQQAKLTSAGGVANAAAEVSVATDKKADQKPKAPPTP